MSSAAVNVLSLQGECESPESPGCLCYLFLPGIQLSAFLWNIKQARDVVAGGVQVHETVPIIRMPVFIEHPSSVTPSSNLHVISFNPRNYLQSRYSEPPFQVKPWRPGEAALHAEEEYLEAMSLCFGAGGLV